MPFQIHWPFWFPQIFSVFQIVVYSFAWIAQRILSSKTLNLENCSKQMACWVRTKHFWSDWLFHFSSQQSKSLVSIQWGDMSCGGSIIMLENWSWVKSSIVRAPRPHHKWVIQSFFMFIWIFIGQEQSVPCHISIYIKMQILLWDCENSFT